MLKNYNNLEVRLGSLVTTNEKIQKNIESHFNLSNKDDDSTSWYNRFNCEYKELKNFIELTKDKNTLLDIGCQFGSFSLTFIGDSTTKQSFAFDGGDTPYLTLSQIKILNKIHNLHPFNFFVGDNNEKIQCTQEELQSLPYGNKDIKMMVTIDTICEIYEITPDVIKLDIEGAEVHALLGAQNTISKNKPIIFMEAHPEIIKSYELSITDLALLANSFISDFNYKILDLNLQEVSDYYSILEQETTDSNRTIWVPN
jgi:FkbM family methyltransferase